MISLSYTKIDSYLDNIPLTKQSRIEYFLECKEIIDKIKQLIKLNHLAIGDIGTGLKTIQFNKFKLPSDTELRDLKKFLMCLGYDNAGAFCILRALKNPITIRGARLLAELKSKEN